MKKKLVVNIKKSQHLKKVPCYGNFHTFYFSIYLIPKVRQMNYNQGWEAGAGAAKSMRLLYQFLEEKSIRKFVNLLLFIHQLRFYDLKNCSLTFFCISSLLGKNIFPNLTNSQEPEPLNEPMQEPEPEKYIKRLPRALLFTHRKIIDRPCMLQ